MSAKENENTAGLLYFIGNNIVNRWDEEAEAAGIVDNKLKKNLELGRERSQSMFKACCKIFRLTLTCNLLSEGTTCW